jgi:hypothetical protein
MGPYEAFPGGLTAPQQWLDNLLPKLPGASIDAIKHEVLTIARDFFEFSKAWTEWVGPILLHASQDTYEIETADIKADCCGVLDVRHLETGDPLRPIDLRRAGPPDLFGSANAPTHYLCPTQQTIQFIPTLTPDSSEPHVTILAWLRPIDLDMPAHLINTNFDAISEGVLSRMYAIPGLLYKPDLIKFHGRRYMNLRAQARIRVESSFTTLGQLASPIRPFARGSYRGRHG